MGVLMLSEADHVDLTVEIAAALAPGSLSVVVPTTRDAWADGLKRSPDIDAFLREDTARGSGVAEALAQLGFGAAWHRGDDTEMALRIVRTELLQAGWTLTEITTALAARRGLGFELLPLSEDRGELHVVVQDGAGRRAIHLDQATHEALPVTDPVFVAEQWSPTEQVRAAVETAKVLLVVRNSPATAHAWSVLEPLVGGTAVIDVAGHRGADVVAAVQQVTR